MNKIDKMFFRKKNLKKLNEKIKITIRLWILLYCQIGLEKKLWYFIKKRLYIGWTNSIYLRGMKARNFHTYEKDLWKGVNARSLPDHYLRLYLMGLVHCKSPIKQSASLTREMGRKGKETEKCYIFYFYLIKF